MSKTAATLLRLYLPASWPSQQTRCEWQLLDTHGHSLQSGHSEPRHWPQAQQCEVVLSADQCLLISLKLPKAARARSAEVIGYALEEQLLGDVANEHFVLGKSTAAADSKADKNNEGNESRESRAEVPVWVISKNRLQALLSTLQALGHAPRRMISELQLLPILPPSSSSTPAWTRSEPGSPDSNSPAAAEHAPACWLLCLKQGRGFLRMAAEAGCSLDLLAENLTEPPLELQLALAAARRHNRQPSQIQIHLAPELKDKLNSAHLQQWQQHPTLAGVQLQLAGEYDWRKLFAQADHKPPRRTTAFRLFDQKQQASSLCNLLTGEFAPARQTGAGWLALRPALWLAALALLIHAAFSFTQWAWLHQEKTQLRQQMIAQFRSSFPQAQTIVDPALQMQRLHDQLRRERGQPAADDFLTLLADASAALPELSHDTNQLNQLAYNNSRLELILTLADQALLQQVHNNLLRRGLQTTIRSTRPSSNGRIEAVFLLTPGLRSAPAP